VPLPPGPDDHWQHDARASAASETGRAGLSFKFNLNLKAVAEQPALAT
jgi:hypothetical protein